MKTGGIAGALALSLMLLTGCGTKAVPGEAQSMPIQGSPRGVAFTAGKAPELSVDEAFKMVPHAAMDAPLMAQISASLRRETLLLVKVKGELGGGDCAGGKLNLAPKATTECTVTYNGLEVPWRITIAEDYKPNDTLIKYTMKPLKGIMHIQSVRALVEKGAPKGVLELRCDEMPEVKLVEVGKPTGIKCQYLELVGTRAQSLVWRDYPVTMNERGWLMPG